MAAQVKVDKKKRGRPATGTGWVVGVRLMPPALAAIDAWAARQSGKKLSRPEAIRRLTERGLAAEAADAGKKPPGRKAPGGGR